MPIRLALTVVLVAATGACSSIASSPYSSSRMGPTDAYRPSSYRDNYGFYTVPSAYAPPLDEKRKIDEQDCSKPLGDNDGNLRCK
ncbi:MAG TPA: hypothetical protein VH600_15090 [Burkholderiales bacterium]|jgi:hypothetical protein